MGNMFPHTPLEAQALIVRLERELAVLKAASAEVSAAYDAFHAEEDSFMDSDQNEYSHAALERARARFLEAKAALKALLGVQDE